MIRAFRRFRRTWLVVRSDTGRVILKVPIVVGGVNEVVVPEDNHLVSVVRKK